MQSSKAKWRADHGARALKTLRDIEDSIAALNDEDLLDLDDIFAGSPASALAILATGELGRRQLSA
jgi:hypothetical protein